MERRRQIMARACDGHMQLLHRLQERRLRARARPVDFVGHQKLTEDRAGDETEFARARSTLFEHFRAEHVAGHQVRRELDPLGREPHQVRDRSDEKGLCEARRADEEGVTARGQRCERQLDHLFLAEDDLPQPFPGGGEFCRNLVELADEVFLCHGLPLGFLAVAAVLALGLKQS
ncbi:MAG: hypothetical protein R3C55_08230 [Parvularculaceae bacterium]